MWPLPKPAFPESLRVDAGSPFEPGVDTQSGCKTYDYIIVGGGTAGCVLASRLSEDTNVTVLIIERGPIADSWSSRVPMISADTYRKGSQAQRWFAQPLSNAKNRCLDVVCGEGLGGTSRINSMVYSRGIPGDYEKWLEQGNTGWGYKDLEPLLAKSEKTLSQTPSSFRGSNGPWSNRTHTDILFKPLRVIERATQYLGFPAVADSNSPHAPAANYAPLDVCIDKCGRRSSTYSAFLSADLAHDRRDNLKICANTLVTRLEISKTEDGLRATGVHFEATDPRFADCKLFARAGEVILCAGAIGSPQLLMLSGIGPQRHLADKGITVVHDLSAVGGNLQDHLSVPLMWEIPIGDSMQRLLANQAHATKELLKYIVAGRGALSKSFMQSSIVVPSELLNEKSYLKYNEGPAVDATLPENVPDIEIMPVPYNCSEVQIDGKGIFSLVAAILQPKSSGSVRLANCNPRARPDVSLGFLTNPADYEVVRTAIKLALRLAEEMRKLGYPLKELSVPSSDSDSDLNAFARDHLQSMYHYTSTCRMGPANGARPAVVGADLCVHGIAGLRVADCSIFPDIVATHPMASTVLVAEKCAESMKSTYI